MDVMLMNIILMDVMLINIMPMDIMPMDVMPVNIILMDVMPMGNKYVIFCVGGGLHDLVYEMFFDWVKWIRLNGWWERTGAKVWSIS